MAEESTKAAATSISDIPKFANSVDLYFMGTKIIFGKNAIDLSKVFYIFIRIDDCDWWTIFFMECWPCWWFLGVLFVNSFDWCCLSIFGTVLIRDD